VTGNEEEKEERDKGNGNSLPRNAGTLTKLFEVINSLERKGKEGDTGFRKTEKRGTKDNSFIIEREGRFMSTVQLMRVRP